MLLHVFPVFNFTYAAEAEDGFVLRKNPYDAYLEGFKDMGMPGDIINCEKVGDSSALTANVPREGLYAIEITYTLYGNISDSVEAELFINGAVPFENCGRLKLKGVWRDKTGIQKDANGNDIRPHQETADTAQKALIQDTDGIFDEPFLFYFHQGENTVGITSPSSELLISQITLKNPAPPVNYEDYIKSLSSKEDGAQAECLKIQAEQSSFKSSSSIYPVYDRTNAATEPSDPVKMRYNTIGGENWKYDSDWIEWDINVTKAGFYELGFRARQDTLKGFKVNRRILIDGEVPFKEFDQIAFPYKRDWYIMTVPYKLYLTEGSHTIRMEVVSGSVAQVIKELENVIYELNYYYRKMVMVTGISPDPYRDYELQKEIPGMTDDFKGLSKSLKEQKQYLETVMESTGSETSSIQQVYNILDSFIEKPGTIPKRLETFKSYVSGLSSWMRTGRTQPLELDFLYIMGSDAETPKNKAGFGASLMFQIRSLIGSFREDYNAIGSSPGSVSRSVNVWVGAGRDQAQIIKELCDSYFTPENSIGVSVKLVQGGILEAALAGKAPDIALFVGGDLPVSLAARDAVLSFDEMDDFDTFKQRYYPQSLVPLTYKDKVYGAPLTQDFPMLFIRIDVLKEDLNITWEINTWDDFYKALPIIQRKNLSVGLGDTTQAILPAGSGNNYGNSFFTTKLLQSGGNYFNSGLTRTTFDSELAVSAFEEWTKFYLKYKFDMTYDFFNRFRTGDMPIAFTSYSAYNLLSVAAPELRGLWKMIPIPGTVREDGSLNRAVNSSLSAAVILKDAENPEDCRTFINWFTGAEIQAQYGKSLEALMGPSARYTTAVKDTLGMLPWTKEEAENIGAQWEQVIEIPSIPASYAVVRNINNAFRKVVNERKNPRTSLVAYNRIINQEITRKWKEIG